MFRFGLACAAAVGAMVTAGTEDAGSTFQKEIRIPANVGFSTNVSPEGKAATVLFDNVVVEVNAVAGSNAVGQPPSNQTAISTKTVTLNIPYSTDQRSLDVRLDVRGFFSRGAGSNIRLVACAGGSTHVLKVADSTVKDVKLKGKCKEKRQAEQPAFQPENFQDRVQFTVQKHAAKPVCQVTLFLAVEHDADAPNSGGALLQIDSLDFEIESPGKLK
jgi:hypothetical protein